MKLRAGLWALWLSCLASQTLSLGYTAAYTRIQVMQLYKIAFKAFGKSQSFLFNHITGDLPGGEISFQKGVDTMKLNPETPYNGVTYRVVDVERTIENNKQLFQDERNINQFRQWMRDYGKEIAKLRAPVDPKNPLRLPKNNRNAIKHFKALQSWERVRRACK